MMMTAFWLLIELVSAIAFLVLIRLKPAQEPQLLAIGLIIAALIYVGFAILGNASPGWIATELAGVGMYRLFAVIGLHYSQWWLMSGWIVHPVWDIGLHGLHWFSEGTTFTPTWYAIACASFDYLIAAYIASVLLGLFNLGKQEHESRS